MQEQGASPSAPRKVGNMAPMTEKRHHRARIAASTGAAGTGGAPEPRLESTELRLGPHSFDRKWVGLDQTRAMRPKLGQARPNIV